MDVVPSLRLREVQLAQRVTPIGETGLVTAVVGQAVVDLADVETAGDAAVYFLGPDYRAHLQQLGLPDEYLPADVGRGQLRQVAADWLLSRIDANCLILQGVILGKKRGRKPKLSTDGATTDGVGPATLGPNGDRHGRRTKHSARDGQPMAQH